MAECVAGYNGLSKTERDANAEMICRAVNSHDELVEIIQRVLSHLKTFEYTRLSDAEEDLYDRCEAALDGLNLLK